MIIRLWRIPDQVMQDELLPILKKYDAMDNRAACTLEMQKIVNENSVTPTPICGLCDMQFLQVLEAIRTRLKSMELYG